MLYAIGYALKNLLENINTLKFPIRNNFTKQFLLSLAPYASLYVMSCHLLLFDAIIV